MMNNSNDRVSFKTHFPFQVSIACWIDLLGYGESLAEAGFNPLDSRSKNAVLRLRKFHEQVALHSHRRFPSLVLNDGAVAYRDLTWNSAWTTFEFLRDAWVLYQAIAKIEATQGQPGARMVISTGFRLRGRRAGLDNRGERIKAVISALKNGQISHEDAVHKAAKINLNYDIVPQLQANFAFTKAYVAEQSGKKAGLGGARCFVDLDIFDVVKPDGLVVGETIHWKSERLNLTADFAPLLAIPDFSQNGITSKQQHGVRSGLQVAQHLAKNDDVLSALRQARSNEPKKGGLKS